ncbi:MFS transporter, partial [Pseudomonas sp. FW305-130]
PIVIGILGETVGWSYGFGAAGIGMLLGLVAFVLFEKDLRDTGRPPRELCGPPVFAWLSHEPLIYLGGIAAVGVVWWLIRSQGAVGILLIGFAGLTVGYIVWRSVFTLPRV